MGGLVPGTGKALRLHPQHLKLGEDGIEESLDNDIFHKWHLDF